MSTTVRVGPATDVTRYLATDHLAWFDEPPSLSPHDELVGVPPEQRFAAELPDADPGSYAGIYGVRPMQLALPPADPAEGARLVPCAGLTWVGVHPDQRRRGVLTAMLRHHVEQTHREGVALSALRASEPAIYGRHGWGVASHCAELSLGRGATLTAPGLDRAAGALRTSMATETGPDLARRVMACELDVAARLPGSMMGAAGFYTAVLRETPEQLRDKEPRRMLFATRDGADVGLAAFRRTHKWERQLPQGTLEVVALVGEPAARLALLRRLVDFDLMSTVKLPEMADDDPVWHWVGPRGAGDVVPADNLWLRIVDLSAALALRGYEGSCHVVVDVDDPMAPWQAGRWRLVVSGGEGRAERTDADPDVSLPVAVLGGLLLGSSNPLAAQRAGLVADTRPGALAELWHAFRTDLPPFASIGF